MEMKILTWNIWSDPRHFSERIISMYDIIDGYDFICLQEVTLESLQMFIEKFNNDYDFYYDISLVSIPNKYGEIIMAKKEFNCEFQTISFPTSINRYTKYINILSYSNISIINVHLDSVFGNDSKTKQEQLKYLDSSVVKANLSIAESECFICGDMNLADEDQGWVELFKQIIDIGGNQNTYDCEKNTNAKLFSSRLDRIFYIGNKNYDIETSLIGTEIIPGLEIHPSDHFGISLEITSSQL